MPLRYDSTPFLIHYGWRGTFRNFTLTEAEVMFLIHYGWRGTRDAFEPGEVFGMFLIHYGWRGTQPQGGYRQPGPGFLIHYGWRGTGTASSLITIRPIVSNPLRLEGDPMSRGFLRNVHYGF